MAKKVLTLIKLQVPGGAANPAPTVGPALGQHGVTIMDMCKAFNAQSQEQNGRSIPDETTEFVECHIRTGRNVRHAEEQLRGTITLPHSAGRDVTVIAFAKGDKAREADAAGADAVGDEDLAKRIQDGWTDFDVAVATPDLMPVVGRLGRILGPQGKMPNPQVGTVTDDVGRAVNEAKAGRMEYRTA